MTPTHAGALAILRESFATLRATIDDLPDSALDWQPLPDANSVAQLVVHSVASSRFFLRAACGDVGSVADYRGNERAESFRARGLTAGELHAILDGFDTEAARMLDAASEESLDAVISWPDAEPHVPARTGAAGLFAVVGHLREHVGHAQLAHDLWHAGIGKNA